MLNRKHQKKDIPDDGNVSSFDGLSIPNYSFGEESLIVKDNFLEQIHDNRMQA